MNDSPRLSFPARVLLIPTLLVNGYSQHPLCFTSLPDYAPRYTQARLRQTSLDGSLVAGPNGVGHVVYSMRTLSTAAVLRKTLVARYSQNSGSTRWCSLSDRVERCDLFDRSCQRQLPWTNMTGGKISSSLRTYYSAGGVDLAKRRASRWVQSQS